MARRRTTRDLIKYRLQKAADTTAVINQHLAKALELSGGRAMTLVKDVPLLGDASCELGKALQRLHDEFIKE